MKYGRNAKNDDKLSSLGLGCMRFPKKGNSVDLAQATQLVEEAVRQGVNYFDTAYMYPGNEQALGTILNRTGLRKQVKIATKLPLFLCKTAQDFDRIFEKQLQRLQTDYIDYYLLHMLSDLHTWERLKALGIETWIATKKQQGKIVRFGFSYHGGRVAFLQLIDAYNWDFCMIQYNYMDEFNQAGKSGLQYAYQKGVPVFIMEPLRGGTLVGGLPPEAVARFAEAHPARTLADWGLRWLFDQKEVAMVLSGMNGLPQLTENLELAHTLEVGCLSEEEHKTYADVFKLIRRKNKVPCTACGYCIPCPVGVDIPTCFSCYNERFTARYRAAIKHYIMNTGYLSKTPGYASRCIGCGKCEEHCPQQIEIIKQLKQTSRTLEPFWFRPARFLARNFTKND